MLFMVFKMDPVFSPLRPNTLFMTVSNRNHKDVLQIPSSSEKGQREKCYSGWCQQVEAILCCLLLSMISIASHCSSPEKLIKAAMTSQ